MLRTVSFFGDLCNPARSSRLSAMTNTLLVTGASGHLGRSVLDALLTASTSDRLVATTRNPDGLAEYRTRGVEVRKASFDDEPAALAKAFAGVDRLLLISTDALDKPGHRLAQHQRAIAAAVTAGVKHVVYTSLSRASESPVLFAPDHSGSEQALADSGLAYTALRNNMYSDYVIPTAKHAVESGVVVSAAEGNGLAYVTRDDCARTAAGALMAGNGRSRILEVGGPEVVTYAQLAQLLSELSGKAVKHQEISLEAYTDGLRQAGLPSPIATVYASFQTAAAQGKHRDVTDVVKSLSGRAPTSLRDFLIQNRAAWS